MVLSGMHKDDGVAGLFQPASQTLRLGREPAPLLARHDDDALIGFEQLEKPLGLIPAITYEKCHAPRALLDERQHSLAVERRRYGRIFKGERIRNSTEHDHADGRVKIACELGCGLKRNARRASASADNVKLLLRRRNCFLTII